MKCRVENLVSAWRRIVAREVPVADAGKAVLQVLHRLIYDLHLGPHAGRGEQARDLGAVLLLGEAGVERGEGIVFDRIYKIYMILGVLGYVPR